MLESEEIHFFPLWQRDKVHTPPVEAKSSSTEHLLKPDVDAIQALRTPTLNLPPLTEGLFRSSRRSSLRSKTCNTKKEKNVDWAKLDIPSESSMQKVVEELLARTKIENATWTEINSGRKIKVAFSLEVGQKCERVKQTLLEWGIGVREGSILTLTPCFFFSSTSQATAANSDESIEEESTKNGGGWERFVASMTARFNVAQLVDEVLYNAELRFDFVSLVVIAS